MNNEKIRFVYWIDNNDWFGYIEDYPDYLTPEISLDDLKEHLKDFHKELKSGEISYIIGVTY